jgi:thiamine-monophosphate kinase
MTSEFELIARHFTRPGSKAVLGIGDDCALLGLKPGLQFAVSTDMLVEGTHFLRGADPEQLGHKSLAVNLSDLAAAGADPAYALLAISLPEADDAWAAAFARGFFSLASQFRLELIGGDTTRGPLTVCVTVIGEVPGGFALTRSGAQAGEDVWVSGATGEAALALAHLQGRTKIAGHQLGECLSRLHTPVPRVELGGRLRGVASAVIDVSDGLLADLGHVARASKASIVVELDRVPQAGALRASEDRRLALECLVAGGDDYELAFVAPGVRRADVEALASDVGVSVTRIGGVVAGAGEVLLRGARGEPVELPRRGFDHFRAGP